MSPYERGSFSHAAEYDDEEITVVHVPGYGMSPATDKRQRKIAEHLEAGNRNVVSAMPEISDTVDGDIHVEVPIDEKVDRLRETVRGISGRKVLALHSQGTIPGLEVVASDPDNELGIVHTFLMGPVVRTSKEQERLDHEGEVWGADPEVMQHVQDRLPWDWQDVLAGGAMSRAFMHYRRSDTTLPTRDVVVTQPYYDSLREWEGRHMDNLRSVLTQPGATVITAGDEAVTDGTLQTFYQELPEVAAYAAANDPDLFYELPGANHNFGEHHRKTIAEIMKARAPVLRPQLVLGAGVVRAVKIQ